MSIKIKTKFKSFDIDKNKRSFIMCPLQGRVIAMLKHLSRVYYVVFPQISWPRKCKGTLVAFVWLFSAVCFQISRLMEIALFLILASVRLNNQMNMVMISIWTCPSAVLIVISLLHQSSISVMILISPVIRYHNIFKQTMMTHPR